MVSGGGLEQGWVIGAHCDPRGVLNQLGFAMWTPTTREQHSRAVARYQTELTHAEWRVISPLLPEPCATGRPREWPMREIVNGIFYVLRGGVASRLLPRQGRKMALYEQTYRMHGSRAPQARPRLPEAAAVSAAPRLGAR